MRQTDSAIARGVAYLQSVQAKDGSFMTQASRGRSFADARNLRTVFGPALILTALARIDQAQAIRDQLATWLLAQKNDDWSFNYWAKDAAERQTRPYPNDLDDTCCALSALYAHDPRLLDGAALAGVVRLLLATEQTVGGPYKTWLVAKDAPASWQDVDLAVNANVAYLLRLVAEPLPNLQQLMERAIAHDKYNSPYYPFPIVVLYYVARAYQGQRTGTLAKQILHRRAADHWQTPAQTALAVSALHQLGRPISPKTRRYLLQQQQADGSWPAEPIWLDEKHGPRPSYGGSAALTTALVLEALAPIPAQPAPDQPDKRLRPILRRAQNQIRQLGEPLRGECQAMLTKLADSPSGHEIILLPQLFAASLKQTPWLPPVFYARLSTANLFGWTAYTIYDDFLDGEGDPRQLSVANIALRKSLTAFGQALPQAAFLERVQQAFTRIDTANAWEVAHCRFDHDGQTLHIPKLPRYPGATFLAERSIGHSLTPLAVLAASGLALDDPRVVLFETGFRHYLAARQLNDDLHDWQEDFARGQISYVVAHLLRAVGHQTGRRQPAAQVSQQLQQQFWHDSLPQLCRTASRQLALSRQAYARSQLLTSHNQFLQLLDKLERALARALTERQKALQFLGAYTQHKTIPKKGIDG